MGLWERLESTSVFSLLLFFSFFFDGRAEFCCCWLRNYVEVIKFWNIMLWRRCGRSWDSLQLQQGREASGRRFRYQLRQSKVGRSCDVLCVVVVFSCSRFNERLRINESEASKETHNFWQFHTTTHSRPNNISQFGQATMSSTGLENTRKYT